MLQQYLTKRQSSIERWLQYKLSALCDWYSGIFGTGHPLQTFANGSCDCDTMLFLFQVVPDLQGSTCLLRRHSNARKVDFSGDSIYIIYSYVYFVYMVGLWWTLWRVPPWVQFNLQSPDVSSEPIFRKARMSKIHFILGGGEEATKEIRAKRTQGEGKRQTMPFLLNIHHALNFHWTTIQYHSLLAAPTPGGENLKKCVQNLNGGTPKFFVCLSMQVPPHSSSNHIQE